MYSHHVPNITAVANLEETLKSLGATVTVKTSAASESNIGAATLHYNGNIIPLGTMPKHKALCLVALMMNDLLK
jgi:hypothetical protein